MDEEEQSLEELIAEVLRLTADSTEGENPALTRGELQARLGWTQGKVSALLQASDKKGLLKVCQKPVRAVDGVMRLRPAYTFVIPGSEGPRKKKRK